jgi:antitoxin component of RelBE/YafQ-DinJ toxin-antitoxin module
MGIEELIASEAEASEQNRDAEIRAGSKVTRGHNRTRTLQVRLNEDEFASLTAIAEQLGVPVSTLARDLLLRQLASPTASPQAVIARMRADLDALASAVA